MVVLKKLLIASCGGFVSVAVLACTSQPPIIADPPQSVAVPPEPIPWEQEYARMRPKPEVFDDDEIGDVATASAGQEFNGTLEHESEEEGGALQIVADVLAFPFRGVGWLIQQIF